MQYSPSLKRVTIMQLQHSKLSCCVRTKRCHKDTEEERLTGGGFPDKVCLTLEPLAQSSVSMLRVLWTVVEEGGVSFPRLRRTLTHTFPLCLSHSPVATTTCPSSPLLAPPQSLTTHHYGLLDSWTRAHRPSSTSCLQDIGAARFCLVLPSLALSWLLLAPPSWLWVLRVLLPL